MHAKLRAAELWHRYELSLPVDLKLVVSSLGLEVVTFPFQGRVKEAIIERVIGVRPGLTRPWFRWLVAHAVGHHMLHVGTSFYFSSWQWVNHAKAERQAEEFAAWFLGGPQGWRYDPAELGIPEEKAQLVWTITSGGDEVPLDLPEPDYGPFSS